MRRHIDIFPIIANFRCLPSPCRNPDQSPADNGQIRVGPLPTVQFGGGSRRPRRGHQQEDLARDYPGAAAAGQHYERRIHAAHTVSGHAFRLKSESRRKLHTCAAIFSNTRSTTRPNFIRYMRYLYPYECKMMGLSSMPELRTAIDSNRRDGGKRSSFGLPDQMDDSSEPESAGSMAWPPAAKTESPHQASTPTGSVLQSLPEQQRAVIEFMAKMAMMKQMPRKYTTNSGPSLGYSLSTASANLMGFHQQRRRVQIKQSR